ncbi:hypothetical protein [Kitasatospora sp. NPDC051914]|uniref:hypothetical protein n=1 Tax=Kitasatospora sp. NPDC051914 TaxID=3154945 RepID=UPI00343FB26D
MGRIRDAAERAAISLCSDRHGNPAGDRRAATLGGLLSSVAADHGHPAAAVVVSVLGATAVAAGQAVGYPEPPEGGYAGFATDGDKPRRGWFR